jgi:hypothetical protein
VVVGKLVDRFSYYSAFFAAATIPLTAPAAVLILLHCWQAVGSRQWAGNKTCQPSPQGRGLFIHQEPPMSSGAGSAAPRPAARPVARRRP